MKDPEMQSSIYDRWEGEHEILYELRDFLISVHDHFVIEELVRIGEIASMLKSQGVKGCILCHQARTLAGETECKGHELLELLDKVCAFDDYLEQLEEDGLL